MARDPRFDTLFTPVRIGPVTAPNRFWQVPHCTGMGYALPATLAAMRGVKAEGGWGVVNSEYCSIHPTSDDTPAPYASLWDDGDIRNMAAMAESVHRHGALAGVELWHGGWRSGNVLSREAPLGPESMMAENVPWQSRRMDRADIGALRDWHRAAALRARDADFDVVYVYAAHTYLLTQFLDPSTNPRGDDYGGTFAARSRLVRELVEDTREAVGQRCAIAIRIEVTDEDGTGAEERAAFLASLAPLVDVFDVTIPDYGIEMGPSRYVKEAALEHHVAHVRATTGKPVVSVGRFTSPETMLRQIRRGIMDFIGAARPSIADPFLPVKIREGRPEDIRECIGCNICYAHDGLGAPIRCTQNPTMGEEWRRGWHPERAPAIVGQADPVLVIGAGPAGLEAAMTLGRRGVPVMLAEASREPGGRVTMESRLPGLTEWARVRDWRVDQIRRLRNVELFLSSAMTRDAVLETGARHVLVATGSRWRVDGRGRSNPRGAPSFADARTMTPEAILSGARPGGPVVIFDDEGYHLAAGLADLLAADGADVTYVTSEGKVAAWSAHTVEQARLQARLIERGVRILTGTVVTGLLPGSASLSCVYTGRAFAIPCAGFVPVTSREPHDGLWTALQDAGLSSLERIGDARAPGLIAHAVHDGHRFARAHLAATDELTVHRERVVLRAT
ncbi:FAD-dependent oxidoreductase [Defluviimonas sp. WL0002]|uniref:FAD-dependent oxidoreductase n=1 Tax=Albidovulum marisflavi TaxID=2984159 RepID=A0ABT2ZAB3_9RHOB|nr:FAD-dependent oxidoreductase [Defluviimonas sp. WL0002]MCV2868078.1 FAD-dependent oxidoreductase [Defluviimonas sp. WL0002]